MKVGDLVKLNATFSPDRHPPMGTLGVVIDVEDWDLEKINDSISDDQVQRVYEQLVWVHWSIEPNSKQQCYVNSSLELVTA